MKKKQIERRLRYKKVLSSWIILLDNFTESFYRDLDNKFWTGSIVGV